MNTYFYREDLGTLVNDLPVYIENWYSDGGMYSTTDDILKFSNALLKKFFWARIIPQGWERPGYLCAETASVLTPIDWK